MPPTGIALDRLAFSRPARQGPARQRARRAAHARRVRRVRAHLRGRADAAVLGMGGYVCLPGGWVAWLLSKPLLLVNADATLLLQQSRRSLPIARPRRVRLRRRRGAKRRGTRRSSPAIRCAPRSRRSPTPARALRRPRRRAAPARRRRQPRARKVLNECVPQAIALMARRRAPARHAPDRREGRDAVRAAYARRAASRPRSLPFIDDMARRLGRVRPDRLPRRRDHGERAVRGRRRRACWCRSSSARPRTSATTRPGMAERGAAIHLPQAELSPERLADLLRGADARRPARDGDEGARAGAAARGGARGRRDRSDGWRSHEARRQEHPLRRHRRRRHERHRRDPAQPRLPRLRAPTRARARRPRRLAELGIRVAIGHDAANIAGAEARRHVDARCSGDNPEVMAARAHARPGRAARGDAGRADAPEAGHRDRRHARQDDDDLARHQRARRGRRRSDLRDRRPAERRRRELAPRRGRLHRRRGRRVGRVVPEPDAGDGGRHEHRRRPHGHLRPRLRAAEAGVRRVHPPHAVLRRGHPVRRRSRRALDHADDLAAGRHLRHSATTRMVRAVDVRGRRRRTMRFTVQRRNGVRMPDLRGDAEPARRRTTC